MADKISRDSSAGSGDVGSSCTTTGWSFHTLTNFPFGFGLARLAYYIHSAAMTDYDDAGAQFFHPAARVFNGVRASGTKPITSIRVSFSDSWLQRVFVCVCACLCEHFAARTKVAHRVSLRKTAQRSQHAAIGCAHRTQKPIEQFSSHRHGDADEAHARQWGCILINTSLGPPPPPS